MEEIIQQIKQKAMDTWSGETGEKRANQTESFLRRKLQEYSEKLGFSQEDILNAMEMRRNYCVVNYYQEAKFPKLEGVRVFKNQEELLQLIPSKTFRCPACAGVSTDPYECNSSKEVRGKICNWKAYGLFRTLGKGMRFIFSESFLENCTVDEIFMPVEFEQKTEIM